MNRKEKFNVYVDGKFVGVGATTITEETPTPVFLSDRLIEVGMQANPKSNMDMAKYAERMLDMLKQAQAGGKTGKQLFNIVQLACDKLNKAGYPYYKPSIFFMDTVKVGR